MGSHLKRLSEALLMSTHNLCFHGEIRKISIHSDWKKKKHLIMSYAFFSRAKGMLMKNSDYLRYCLSKHNMQDNSAIRKKKGFLFLNSNENNKINN